MVVEWPPQAASRWETSSSHPDPLTDQLLPSQAAAAIREMDDEAVFSNASADKIETAAERKYS